MNEKIDCFIIYTLNENIFNFFALSYKSAFMLSRGAKIKLFMRNN